MNANELADDWERTAFISEESKQECGDKMAAMLRQQQAEIEVLRSELDRAVENYTDKAIENEALRSLSLRRENLGYFYDLHARQQAEIESLLQFISERGETRQLIIWKAQEK